MMRSYALWNNKGGVGKTLRCESTCAFLRNALGKREPARAQPFGFAHAQNARNARAPAEGFSWGNFVPPHPPARTCARDVFAENAKPIFLQSPKVYFPPLVALSA